MLLSLDVLRDLYIGALCVGVAGFWVVVVCFCMRACTNFCDFLEERAARRHEKKERDNASRLFG